MRVINFKMCLSIHYINFDLINIRCNDITYLSGGSCGKNLQNLAR